MQAIFFTTAKTPEEFRKDLLEELTRRIENVRVDASRRTRQNEQNLLHAQVSALLQFQNFLRALYIGDPREADSEPTPTQG